MKFEEYLQLASKIEEYEKQIILIYDSINEVTDFNDLYAVLDKKLIDYIKNNISVMDEIILTDYFINNEAYFGFNLCYNPHSIVHDTINEFIPKNNTLNYTAFVDKAISILIEKYNEFAIEKDIFISYSKDFLYFKNIKKFNDLFDKEKIAELNELMIFK